MPIKDGKYKNPNWVDGGPPAVDADELNAISSTLESLDAAGGTGGDGKRYARIRSTTVYGRRDSPSGRNL